MVMRRSGRFGLALVLALGGVSCKKEDTASGDDGVSSHSRSKPKGPPPRLAPEDLDEIGEQPGFLADGMMFAAVRAGAAQAFLRQLPLPSELTRELARARAEIGFDLLSDDVLERFAIPEDAIISMTLGRPVGWSHVEPVRTSLARGGRFLGNVARVLTEQEESLRKLDLYLDEKPLPEPYPAEKALPVEPYPEEPTAMPMAFSEPVPAVEEEPPPPPPPPHPIEPEPIPDFGVVGGVPGEVVGGVLGEPYDPTPPPLSPAERKEVEDLLAHADAMAFHLHFHIPTDDPSKLLEQLRQWAPARQRAAGDELCRGLETELCATGGSRDLVVVRRDGDAVLLDLVIAARSDAGTSARRAAVAEALSAKTSSNPVLEQMAGDASFYLDAEGLAGFFEHERTGSTIRRLVWAFDEPQQVVDRRSRETEAMRKLMDTPRLFHGLLANAHHDRERSQLQVTWPLRDGQQELAEKALAPPPLAVPVPTVDALCDGALACARSRGIPRPETLGSTLAQGVYGNARALEEAIDEGDEAAELLLMASTWPNALGTATWHLPLAEAHGPEAAIVRGLIDALGRIQGLGLSLRRLDVGRRSAQAEYAAYARVPASDLALVSTMLSMAEQRLTPTTVDGVEGEVMMLRAPDDDVPAVLMTSKDPEAVKDDDGKEVQHGWLTVVDAEPRLSWLLGLATDDGHEPMLYLELPELWRMISSFPDAIDELGFARTWASERSFKASLHLDDGQPHIWMEVARTQQADDDDD